MPKEQIEVNLRDNDCVILSILGKLPNYEQLHDSIACPYQAAYIYAEESDKKQLYYINKIEKIYIPIEVEESKLEIFKTNIQIPEICSWEHIEKSIFGIETRTLSSEELFEINQLTGHYNFSLTSKELEHLQLVFKSYPNKEAFKENLFYPVLNKEIKLSSPLVKHGEEFYILDNYIDYYERDEYTRTAHAKALIQNGKIKLERCHKEIKIKNWYQCLPKVDKIAERLTREVTAIKLTGSKNYYPHLITQIAYLKSEYDQEQDPHKPKNTHHRTGYLISDKVPGEPIKECCFASARKYTDPRVDLSKLPLRKRLELLIQLCFQVNALHQKNLLHGDLTTENILYDADKNSVQLVNFGRSLPNERSRGTSGFRAGEGGDFFRAPEERYTGSRTIQGDIYSLAGIAAEILGTKNILALKNKENKNFDYSPFSESYDALEEPYDFSEILNGYDLSTATEKEINEIKQILAAMSDKDPQKRPDLNEVIQQLRSIKNELTPELQTKLELQSDTETKDISESDASEQSSSDMSTSNDPKRLKKVQIALANAKTDPVMQKFADSMTQRLERWQQHHTGKKYCLELTYNDYPSDEKIQKDKIYLYKKGIALEYAVMDSAKGKVKRIPINKKQLGSAFENIHDVLADSENRKKLSYGEEQAIFRLTEKQGYYPSPLSAEDLKQLDDKTKNVDNILNKRVILADSVLKIIDKKELLTTDGIKRILEQKLKIKKEKVDLIVDLLSPDKIGLFEEIASKLITEPCKNLPNPLLIKLDFEHEDSKFKTIVNEEDVSFKASLPIHFIGNGYTKIIGKAIIGFSVNKERGEVNILPAHINFDLLATRDLFDEKNTIKELKEKYDNENIKFGVITEKEEIVQSKIDKAKIKVATLIPKNTYDDKQLDTMGLSSKIIEIETTYLKSLQPKLIKHFKKLVKSAHNGSRTLVQVEDDINLLDKFINSIPIIQNHVAQANENKTLTFDKEGYKKHLLEYAKIEEEWKNKLLPKISMALDILGKIIFLLGGTVATWVGITILVVSILLFIPSAGLSTITELLGASTIFTGVAGIWIGLGLGAAGLFKIIENSIGFFNLDKFSILAEKLGLHLELNPKIASSQKNIISQFEIQAEAKNETSNTDLRTISEDPLNQKEVQNLDVIEKKPNSPKSETETSLHTSSDSENEQKEDVSSNIDVAVMGMSK